jgi:hypothetical protein
VSGYNYGSDSEFEDERPESGGSGLRKQLEEALAEIKALRAERSQDKRDKTVNDLLKEKELDPAIAQLIPNDADPAKWLEEKAHLFATGFERTQVDNRPELDTVQVEQPSEEDLAVLLEEQRALEVMSNAQASGTPATPSSDLLEQLNKFQGNEDELLKFFQQNGAPNAF